ncbi:VIT1/CCC1 transporter family protein [Alicyclobacillus sendaiensis]|uniref:VIT1/CCC1 transporter family protein n=1 Tax=Alicyclobacillus sendaiensis TaxID=192387 RepID=UPI0007807A89|nr:VIT1/CCC1 transporter family protein [Alicyclobacillus sendaiensis]
MSTLSPSAKLDELMGREQRKTPSWIGDAIYGVNDGLGAIFGIIAGVAGYTDNNQTILISGFFGALASTLSMAAGAWLATRSENELLDKAFHEAQRDIEQNREREIQILSLIYETRGFEPHEARDIAERIARDDDLFLRTMAQEKHGIHEASRGNPWAAALSGGLSTFIGGVVPLIPFFFMHGLAAVIAAAAVSLAAHFVVGALKSLVTVRSWWSSGIEMTIAGIIVGIVSYLLGLVGSHVL